MNTKLFENLSCPKKKEKKKDFSFASFSLKKKKKISVLRWSWRWKETIHRNNVDSTQSTRLQQISETPVCTP